MAGPWEKYAKFMSGLDDAALSDDPQSAVIARAQKPVTDAAIEQIKSDYANRLTYQDAVAAAKGDPAAREKVASNSLGFAMGSMGAKAPKGLAMDEASRMARAKEMGFDTGKTYFHGTAADIDRFKPSGRNGAMLGEGVYLTEDPEYAAKYAAKNPNSSLEDKTGGNILPVHTNISNPFDLSAPASQKLVKALKAEPGIDSDLLAHLHKPGKDNGDVLAAMQGNRIPFWRQTQLLEDMGHDGVKDGEILNVFDPSQIRSKFAEFNPKKAKSGNISAAIGAAALGAGAATAGGSEAQASDTIPMQGPDGKIRMIPENLKGEAIAAGGKVVR